MKLFLMQKYKTVLKFIIAFLLLVYLLSKVNRHDILELFSHIVWWWFAGLLVLRGLALTLNTFRWRMLLMCHGYSIELWELFKARLVGILYSNVLPSGMGGELMRAYFLTKRDELVMANTVSTVVVEKVSGIIALIVYLSAAILINIKTVEDAGVASMIIILMVALGIVVVLLLNRQLYAEFSEFVQKRNKRFSLALLRYYSAIHHFHQHRAQLVASIVFSLIVQFLTIVMTWFGVLSLGIDLSFLAMVLIVPLIGLSNIIPVSIGNWGFREGVYVIVLQLFGIGATPALALALLMRIVGFLLSLLGFLIVISKQGAMKRRIKKTA